ncbi:hypothetical protein L1D31_22250 [Vibrio sp. Isolate23]|uniref:hypothetical protein n=1 Tax=Vibrio sp. Isolate23 TaxID=2908533 RepID=UPI001EFE65FB|nr:hypothetical protein [Vibrio sp. Isolate23]MCG9685241.1 hypothetical protein [Vibrio sp. Isolate23]
MKHNFFSESFNVPAGLMINPANGTLSLRLKLASISTGENLPATFDLCLDYRPMDKDDLSLVGFLESWRICVPRYIITPDGNYIQMSDGSIQPIDKTTGKLIYHKRKDIIIDRTSGGLTRHSYKDGRKEYFFNKMIVSTVSPLGHEIKFNYDDINRDNPFLKDITNDQGDRITITHKEIGIDIKQFVDGIERTVEIIFQASSEGSTYLIKEINYKNNSESTTLNYAFTYVKIDGNYHIKTIKDYFGNVIDLDYWYVKYDDNKTVPFIEKYSDSSGKEIRYNNIGNNNYTGYEKGKVQNPNIDNCFYKDEEYNYKTSETSNGYSIERTYNKFHCLIREVIKEKILHIENLTLQKNITYHNVEGSSIDKQPPQYLDVSEIHTIDIEDESKLQTERKEYYTRDDYGNITRIINSENTVTTREYKTSSVDSRFKHNLVKEIISSPGSSDHKTKEIKYKKYTGLTYRLPVTSETFTAQCELPTETSINNTNTKIVSYLESSSIGRFILTVSLKRLFTHSDLLTIEYVYSNSRDIQGAVEILEKYKWSNLEATKRLVTRTTLNQVLLEVDFDHIETTYTYDLNGFLTHKTKYSNTVKPYVEEYSYQLNDSSVNTYETKKDGVTRTFEFDAVERLVRESRNGFLVKDLTYSKLTGYACYQVNEKIHDQASRTILSEYEKFYTVRGNCFIKSRNLNNQNTLIVNKHIGENKQSTFSYGGNSPGDTIAEFYNLEGEVIRVEINRGRTVENEIDIFGRVKKRNIYIGSINVTESILSYDVMDRLTNEIIQTDNGRDIYEYRYPSLYIDIPSRVTVRSTFGRFDDVPNRGVDPLGRIVSEGYLVSGIYRENKIYEYQFGRSKPNRILSPKDGVLYECDIDSHSDIVNSESIHDSLSPGPQLFMYEMDDYYRLKKCTAYKNDIKYLEQEIEFTSGNLERTDKVTFFPSGTNYSLKTQLSSSGERIVLQQTHLNKDITFTYDNNGLLVNKSYRTIGGIFAVYSNRFDLPDELSLGFNIKNEDGEAFGPFINFVYDNNGIEISREYTIDGSVIFKHNISEIEQISKKVKEEIISKGVTQPESITRKYSYTKMGELSQSIINNTSGTITNNYEYGGIGRIKSLNISDGSKFEFNYDGENSGEVSDKLNNIRIDNKNTIGISYDTLNNISIISEGDKNELFNHDANGKLIQSYSIGEFTSEDEYEYFYNYKEQLIRVLKKDPDDESVKQEIIFLYSNDELIGEENLTTGVKTLYIRYNGMVIARYSEKGDENEITMYCTDRKGSVYAIFSLKNKNGTYVEHRLEYTDYSDYGEMIKW